ncbi:hypothetical protein M0R45_000561 [Rubus argutus]|uniref:Uncharacterized protein n=1 Tax=Rubus argutus TaxID=59490 RepID=A0AAW1VPT8_RUBAR
MRCCWCAGFGKGDEAVSGQRRPVGLRRSTARRSSSLQEHCSGAGNWLRTGHGQSWGFVVLECEALAEELHGGAACEAWVIEDSDE